MGYICAESDVSAVLSIERVTPHTPRPLARRRPRPPAAGRDRDRPHPARRAPAPGGPGRPLRRQPHAGARGAAPAAGDRARRPARPPRRGRAPVQPEECRNVYLVRAELEGLAAERSAGRLTGYDKADLDVAQALLRTGYERHRLLGARRRVRPRDPVRAVVTGKRAVPQRDPGGGRLPAAARHGAVAPERRPALDRVADVRRRPRHHPAQRRRPRPHRRGAGQARRPPRPPAAARARGRDRRDRGALARAPGRSASRDSPRTQPGTRAAP